MSRRRAIAVFASFSLISAGCGPSEPVPAAPIAVATMSAAPSVSTPPPPHAVDVGAMDRAVRPGNDFFAFANGTWVAKTPIPADEVAEDVWGRLGRDVEKRIQKLVESANGASSRPEAKRIGDFYASYMDEAAIEKRGLAPLAPGLARLAKIADKRALATEIGLELRPNVDPLNLGTFYSGNLFGLWVEQSFSEPTKNSAFLLQGGLLLTDRDQYLAEGKAKDELRAKFERHVVAMLKLAGVPQPEAKAARIIALEKKIARLHTSRADSSDVSKANNPWPRSEFKKRAPGLDWDAFFAAGGLDQEATIVVWQPATLIGLSALVKSEPLDVWKEWLTAHAIEHASFYLPKALAEEHLNFYFKELRGGDQLPARWRNAVNDVVDTLGEDLGKLYVADYFSPDSKKQIQAMVSRLFAVYGKRIDALTWMSAATKAKAKAKLATLRVGIGYPDAWRQDTDFEIKSGDAFGNFERAEARARQAALAKLHGPVRRGEWVMTPETVDAVNLPVRNEIHFPAAILVPPFFDPSRTAAANYGAIGAIIGHEISHSFDSEGAKFDAEGHLANWWTAEDLAHFQTSCAALVSQYNGYKPLADASVDGKLTLGENIADLAGLSAAFDAWQASLEGAPAPTVDGLTGEQQFFLSFAQVWQAKWREPLMREQLVTNGHAPPQYRASTVRNLDGWYRAFDVKPTDSLFLAPKDRVQVW